MSNMTAACSSSMSLSAATPGAGSAWLPRRVGFRARLPVVRAATTSNESTEPPPPEMRRKTLSEIMGFGGYAPEVINGRLAQIGIVAGLGAEAVTGESFPSQFVHHFPSFLLTAGVITLASFVPLFRGQTFTADPKTMKPEKIFGPFSETAEIFNSRAAMIGIVAILALEGLKGGPLITLNEKPSLSQDQPLTASSIRQDAIQRSRVDGFEPRADVAPAATVFEPAVVREPAASVEAPPPAPLAAAPSVSESYPGDALAPPAVADAETNRQIKELEAEVMELRSQIRAIRASGSF